MSLHAGQARKEPHHKFRVILRRLFGKPGFLMVEEALVAACMMFVIPSAATP